MVVFHEPESPVSEICHSAVDVIFNVSVKFVPEVVKVWAVDDDVVVATKPLSVAGEAVSVGTNGEMVLLPFTTWSPLSLPLLLAVTPAYHN